MPKLGEWVSVCGRQLFAFSVTKLVLTEFHLSSARDKGILPDVTGTQVRFREPGLTDKEDPQT